MFKYATFSILVLLASSVTNAQEQTYHVSTTVPDSARYEIVQSFGLITRLTIRLDRYTGRTWVMPVVGDVVAWQTLPWADADSGGSNSKQPRYQIFSSSNFINMTLLMNTDSGRSWYIELDLESGLYWTSFD